MMTDCEYTGFKHEWYLDGAVYSCYHCQACEIPDPPDWE